MPKTDTPTRFDVYRAVTDSIIAAIERGAGAFVMPWHSAGAAIAKPENACTRMEYHGINVIALWAEAYVRGYTSGHWASYKQWQQAGGQVREGERGARVVFFKQLERAETNGSGDEQSTRSRLVARASCVFNADQVAGWQPPPPRRFGDPVDVLASVATFTKATGARIVHDAANACYDVIGDVIKMPATACFVGSPTSTPSEAYHATLLHELVHWTGVKHRLDRAQRDLTRADLACEELVAEIGAAFLCADLGVANEPRPDHAAYVADWLRLLKNDTRAVFAASRLASKAANYLHEIAGHNDW